MVSSSSLMPLPSLLVGKLALPPLMRRRICRCRNGKCCYCHDGVIALVDAQACLRRCQASAVALTTFRQADVITHVAMALLPSMCRVFTIVTIAFFPLMTMVLLPLLMHRHPCHCRDGVVSLVTMASLPLIRNGVVALIAMASLLSSSWCHCPAFHCRRLHK
jgi:hypothetical protein